MESRASLHSLPEELFQQILQSATRQDLKSLNATCKWTYARVTPLLWQTLTLIDRTTTHRERTIYHHAEVDEHDDTPILRQLLLLAHRPWLASHVRTITHRCHLPVPHKTRDLDNTQFCGQTLSPDPRTAQLVKLAVQGMTKVSTLRIILGHVHIVDALLRCLFDRARVKFSPVRKLWLESCQIDAVGHLDLPPHPMGMPTDLDFDGLESMHLKRLPMETIWSFHHSLENHVYARGGHEKSRFHNARGRKYYTGARPLKMEIDTGGLENFWTGHVEYMFSDSFNWDNAIYKRLAAELPLPDAVRSAYIPDLLSRARTTYLARGYDEDQRPSLIRIMTWSDARRERTSGASATMRILSSATATLTSLCFDWVITNKFHGYPEAWTKTLIQLFSLRFPRLRTFQLRNATREMTQLPGGIFLLSRCTYGNLHKLKQKKSNAGMMCLEFMEAHPRLRCLAWPISQFFSNEPMSAELDRRVQAVVKKLGENLVELRVDEITGVDEGREEFSHADNLVGNVKRNQRRRFVEQFAPQMRELECFTMKGDIPRDERRELMRALHQCSLKKISVVGISWPPGNTWGPGSRDTRDPQAQLLGMSLAGEHHPSTYALGAMQELKPVGSDFSFEPSYGWHESPPLLRTLATFHASTVTELNFSGFRGAPGLYVPTSVTHPLLAPLRHFDQLQNLSMSFWLSTYYERASHDAEVVDYWKAMASPEPESLVTDEQATGWEHELRTQYHPRALAWEVTRILGRQLSRCAKSAAGGVAVRATVSVGSSPWEFALRIGRGSLGSNVCLEHSGPWGRVEEEEEQRTPDAEYGYSELL